MVEEATRELISQQPPREQIRASRVKKGEMQETQNRERRNKLKLRWREMENSKVVVERFSGPDKTLNTGFTFISKTRVFISCLTFL